MKHTIALAAALLLTLPLAGAHDQITLTQPQDGTQDHPYHALAVCTTDTDGDGFVAVHYCLWHVYQNETGWHAEPQSPSPEYVGDFYDANGCWPNPGRPECTGEDTIVGVRFLALCWGTMAFGVPGYRLDCTSTYSLGSDGQVHEGPARVEEEGIYWPLHG